MYLVAAGCRAEPCHGRRPPSLLWMLYFCDAGRRPALPVMTVQVKMTLKLRTSPQTTPLARLGVPQPPSASATTRTTTCSSGEDNAPFHGAVGRLLWDRNWTHGADGLAVGAVSRFPLLGVFCICYELGRLSGGGKGSATEIELPLPPRTDRAPNFQIQSIRHEFDRS